MPNSVDVKVSNYLPFNFIIVGYGLIVGGLIALSNKPEVSPFFLIIGLLMVTTHYRIKIDLGQKEFREYVWFFGFKNGNSFKFSSPEYIYFNETRSGFEYGDFAFRRFGFEKQFKAFIKFSAQDERAYIGSSRSFESILSKSKSIASQLNIPIKEMS